MENLHRLRLIPVLEEFVRLRKWLFGICVGFQILFSESEEFGAHVGLGIFPGKVRRFAGNVTIPHMGWNDVEIADPSHPLLQGLPKRPLFYFIHSYYADCPDSAYILGRCEYHRTFTAVVGRDRIFGTQFHPEKSHSDGLKIIENLLACIGREAA